MGGRVGGTLFLGGGGDFLILRDELGGGARLFARV